MNIFESIKIALISIMANKMRSLLTMLGIIIGISAVITITTIGSSIQATLKNTINDLGGVNDINISVQLKDEVYEEEDFDWESLPDMTDEDKISDSMIAELQEKYPGWYSTVKDEYLGHAVMYNYNNYEMSSMVMGVSDGYLASYKIKFLSGRDINENDLREAKNVCVVSDMFARNYFPKGTDPLHKSITLNFETGDVYDFTIVGIFKNDARVAGPIDPSVREIDQTTLIGIPIDTVYRLQGAKEKYTDFTYIKWNTDYDKAQAEQQVQDFLDEKYKANPYYHAVIDTQENDIFEQFNMVINIVTIAITVISAISLIVGGVGVMNIMLVSVTERTREIGIRKAIGAQTSAIRTQFVIESIILCTIGGVIGILIGIMNGIIVGQIAVYAMHVFAEAYEGIISLSIQPNPVAIILSVMFSMMTGIFFGYYPANKAAQMNTIDALRYE